MIALGILSSLTIAVVQSIRQAMQNKKRIEMLNDHQAVLRDVVDVMTQDIKLAFHYRDIHQEMEAEVKKKIKEAKAKAAAAAAASGGNSNPAPTTPANTTEEEVPKKDTGTHFLGKSDEIHFVTLNFPYLKVDQKTADYAEVGYRLGKCKSRADRNRETQCIFRRTSWNVDDEVAEGGREIPLLEDVTKLEFSYYGLGKLDYVSDWKTFETNDDVTKNRYPELVKIQLTVAFPQKNKDKKKVYSREWVVPILFPNNPEEDDEYDEDDFEDDEEGIEEGP